MNTVTRAVGGALALAVPVVAETTHVIDVDGAGGHAAFGLSQLLGWTALLTVCRDVGRIEAGRWGRRLTLAGVGAQLAFALLYLVTAVTSGEPSGAVWPVFLLGFVCLTAGGLVWARALRSAGATVAAHGLAAVAVLGVTAMVVGSDPFHDLALVGSYLAWVAVGRGVDSRTAAPEQPRPAAAVPR